MVHFWVLKVKSSWLIFCPLAPDLWIRKLRIRIQEAKILRIQRIRILSTGNMAFARNVYSVRPPIPYPYGKMSYTELNTAIVQCTLYSVHSAVYTVQCTLCSLHYTVYTVHFTLCSLHYTVYPGPSH